MEGIEETLEAPPHSPAEVSPASGIDSLLDYLRTLAEPKALDAHMANKLQKNRLSFAFPPNDSVTRVISVKDGFTLGFTSGKVMRVLPPAFEFLELADTPITGLAMAGLSILVIATETRVFGWTTINRKIKSIVDTEKPVSFLESNTPKDLVIIGCSTGSVLLYKITNYDSCTISKTYEFAPLSQKNTAEVVGIKTSDSTTWFVAMYASKCMAIFDHESHSLLYHFVLTGGNVFPTIFPQGKRIVMPSILWHEDNWLVTPEFILLATGVIFKLSGNVVSSVYHTSKRIDPLDAKWERYAMARKRGFGVFSTDSFLVIVTKAGTDKTPETMKLWPLIEIDLGITFVNSVISEYNTYLGLLSKDSLEVITVVGVESTFMHTLTNLYRYRNTTGCIHERFLKMIADNGSKPLFAHSYARWIPFISKRAKYGVVQLQKSKRTMEIINISTGANAMLDADGEIHRYSFSKDDTSLAVLSSKSVSVWTLSSMQRAYDIPGTYTKKAVLRYTLAGALFIFANREVIMSVGATGTTRDVWPYDNVAWLSGESDKYLGYTKAFTAFCVWTGSSIEKTAEISMGFENLKVFNLNSMCAGFSVSGIDVLSLPSLRHLMHIDSENVLIVDKDGPLFCTYAFDASSQNCGKLRVWDLPLGIPVWNVDMGLKTARGASSETLLVFAGWVKARIDFHKPNNIRLYRTWGFDISSLLSLTPLVNWDLPSVSLFEEKFESHCVLLRMLSDLVSSGKYDPCLSKIVLVPFRVTIVHILVYRNQPTFLQQALRQRASIVRSCFGTPIRLCIERNSRKCLDVILQAIIEWNETDNSELLTTLYHVSEDMQGLIRFGSAALPEFLRLLMQPKPEEMIVSPRNALSVQIPCSIATSSLWIERFTDSSISIANHKSEAVEYKICPVAIHSELGSPNSLEMLKLLVFDITVLEILNNDLIKTLINMKWNKLWLVVLAYTVLYWGFLVLVLMRLFKYEDTTMVDAAFLALNSFFLLFEICQAVAAVRQYVKSRWDYLDLLRCGFSYAWVASDNPDIWLTFVTVLLCIVRGVTTFQTFEPTRFFVRMIYVCCIKTVSFIFILIYSTLAFGLLFAAADPAAVQTFTQSWSLSSQLDMGGFDMSDAGGLVWAVFLAACLVNVVWLLNLLISILGSAYEEFKPEAEGADVLAKADLVYQYESMMVWKRGTTVQSQFVQTCTLESSTTSGQSIVGRIAQLSEQMTLLEGKLATSGEIKALRDEMESRFLEIRTLMKQRVSEESGEKQQEAGSTKENSERELVGPK